MFLEATTMKLHYRGQTYEANPTNAAPDTHEVITTYRGVKSVVRHGDRAASQHHGEMKYRGLSY